MTRLESEGKCIDIIRKSAGRTDSANQDCGIGWARYILKTLYEEGYEVRKVRADNDPR